LFAAVAEVTGVVPGTVPEDSGVVEAMISIKDDDDEEKETE
jgi:hypothetical protein